MKSILPCSKETYRLNLKRKKYICIAVAAVTVLLNLVLCLLRSDGNANLLKWINILLDVIVGWLLFGYASMEILPAQKLYSLAMRAEKAGVRLQGTVSEVSEKTEHNNGLTCKAVKLAGETLRRVYLPEMITLHVGDEVQLLICDNIVVEVVQ